MGNNIDLQFLGCGAAFNPLKKNTNAFFEFDTVLCLIDCGESAFEQIFKRNLLQDKKAVLVLLSHLHADHVGSLASLISYAAYVLNIPVHVVHPTDVVVKLLDILGIKSECYEYGKIVPAQFAKKLQATFTQVQHVDNMQCFGITIKMPDWHVYFSGDAVNIPAIILEGLKKGDIQKIYQDTCSKTTSHQTHCSLHDLEKLIPADLRSKVYCMHFDTDFTAEIKKSGFNQVSCQA